MLSLARAALAAPPELPAESAASAEEETLPPRVEELLQQAKRLRREGGQERALSVLEQAHELAPGSTRVDAHLAAAYQALGDWIAAKDALSRVLSRADDAYVRRNRALLEGVLANVDDHLGQLELLVSPAAARVRIDGRELAPLPLAEPLQLVAGEHVLEAYAGGYHTISRSLRVRAGQRVQESVELLPRLELSAPPPAAAVEAPCTAGTGPRPLTWLLTGAAAAGLATTGVAWALREHHAQTWNAPECLVAGRTREQQCGSERQAAHYYGNVAVASGAATAALGVAAALSAWLWNEPAPSEQVASGCRLQGPFLSCGARF